MDQMHLLQIRALSLLARVRLLPAIKSQKVGAMYVLETRRLKLLKEVKNIFSISGVQPSDHDAINLLYALTEDSVVCERFNHYPSRVIEELAKHDYEGMVFLPCTPMELSSWVHDDKIYLSNPRLLHSIRFLEKNVSKNVFGIYMKCPIPSRKVGNLRFIHGKLNNICGIIEHIICSANYDHIANSIIKSNGQPWTVETFKPFIKSSAMYRVTISKLGIDEKIEAVDSNSALAEVLDKAWKNSDKSGFYRRPHPDYIPSSYSPEFMPDIVKLASTWPPKIGSKVRARPSNGMPGGKIGVVSSVNGGYIVVNYEGTKIKYDINDPRTIVQIDTDLT